MADNVYTVGDLVHVEAAFTDADGAAVDPSAVTAMSKSPSGTITSLSVTDEAGTGLFSADINVTESGVWTYRFAGTGTSQAAQEGRFRVNDSAFD